MENILFFCKKNKMYKKSAMKKLGSVSKNLERSVTRNTDIFLFGLSILF